MNKDKALQIVLELAKSAALPIDIPDIHLEELALIQHQAIELLSEEPPHVNIYIGYLGGFHFGLDAKDRLILTHPDGSVAMTTERTTVADINTMIYCLNSLKIHLR